MHDLPKKCAIVTFRVKLKNTKRLQRINAEAFVISGVSDGT